MADWRKNYAASSAPLPAGNLVISGVGRRRARRQRLRRRVRSGHRQGGLALLDGAEAGRRPAPRRGRARTSSTAARRRGSPAATIPALDLVYWPTGNPSKEYNGDDRKGDNLYASCILALDRKTGTLKWHYQFTPHDLWDWDATQTSVLVDATWQGQPRKLLLHADPQRLLLRLRSRRPASGCCRRRS